MRRRNVYKIFFHLAFALSISASSLLNRVELKLFKDKYTIEKIEKEDDFQYPGNDNNSLLILHKKWNEYYKCLEKRQDEESKPNLRRLIEGQNTVFECNICVRPFQNFEELQWQYKPLSSEANITKLELLDLTPEMELLPNKTLKIFNAVRDFEGLYVCFHVKNPVAIFILEISPNDTIERVVSSYDENKNSLVLEGTKYKIEYQWNEWSECSTCATVGRKYKYGTCFVSKMTPDEMFIYSLPKKKRRLLSKEDYLPMNFIANTENITRQLSSMFHKFRNTTSEGRQEYVWGAEIITKFSNGVPCASPYLPKAALEETKNYKPARAVVKFCHESCQHTEIFEAEDRFGKIERANNSAGIYSIYQKLPRLIPEIERTSLTSEVGNDIIIQCPGTSLKNIPVTWAVNKKIIYPEVIANQSQGRFEIDLVNRINLKKLRLKDSHIYSCWHRDRLVGTVHLEVEKKLKLRFNHHITLLGMAAVIGTFLLVGAKVLTRTLNSKRK